MENVWIVTAIDRIGTADEVSAVYGVYSSEDKALAAVLYWIFDMGERPEDVQPNTISAYTDYITTESIWRVERVELDFVI